MTPAPGALPPFQTVVVALGSNLGDSPALVASALDQLRPLAAGTLRASSLWHTEPLGCPPGSPPFINAVCLFGAPPGGTPESLLAALQAIERAFGRRPRIVRNEARPLDLDLIAFGDEVRSGPDLTLPHPRAHLRAFVLAPLCEIAPGLRLPGWTASAAELLAALPPDPPVLRLPPAANP